MVNKLCCYLLALIASSLLLLTTCTAPEVEPILVEREPTPIPALVKMDMPVVEPRPEFINALRPPEYYRIPLSLYNYHPEGLVMHKVRDYDPANLSSIEHGFQSSICLDLFARLLAQEGDILTGGTAIIDGVEVEREEMEDRMELLVDKNLVETEASTQYDILSFLPTREPESPRTYFVSADYCWEVPLPVGKHEVTFRFHQTSGDMKTYTWYFEISE